MPDGDREVEHLRGEDERRGQAGERHAALVEDLAGPAQRDADATDRHHPGDRRRSAASMKPSGMCIAADLTASDWRLLGPYQQPWCGRNLQPCASPSGTDDEQGRPMSEPEASEPMSTCVRSRAHAPAVHSEECP